MKIDLKHAYPLVPIADGDESKTAFHTCYGSFEWMVMPFGLSNAPAVFQCFINEVLGDLHDVCTIGYLDDILIYSDSLDNHCLHMSKILHCLREASLYANPKKCVFHTDTVEYLGFILSLEGLRMDPSNVDAIQSWPEPQNVHDVQSFLGFNNFYRQFIHRYSEMTLPLTTLCRKSTKWRFDKFEKDAFQCLKEAFTTAPVLCYWSPDLPMTVETDTSDQAIMAILSV